MKKAIWLLLLALLLACGPSTANTQPADTDDQEDTAVANVEVTADANDETTETDTPVAGATNLEDFSPAGTVEEAAVVREQDWQKGAADPSVVIIEYGDFQ
jgi:hypothetical protein